MSDEQLLAFSRALADSVASGLPLAATLRELDGRHGGGLAAAAEKVAAGEPLHASLGGGWPPVLRALVRAGEESGKLDAFLSRYAAALELRIAFRRRLQRAALYPLFALALALALFVLFSAKAAPLLFSPLVEAGAPLPAGAQRVIDTGTFLLERWRQLLGGLFAAYLLLRALALSRPVRKLLAAAGHWLPGARYALSEARHAQFASTLALLLNAGLRPRQTLELLAENFADDPVLSRRLRAAAAALSEGAGYTESLGGCLPEEDRTALAVAEKSGRLDSALEKLATSHGERHAHRLRVVATAFQLAAVCALAPVAFGLAVWVLSPAVSLLQNAAGLTAPSAPLYRETGSPGPGSIPAPPPSLAPAVPDFNETQARRVVERMSQGQAAVPKPVPKPKLQPRRAPRGVEPTKIESGFGR
jgi:general secretion pathway protein F